MFNRSSSNENTCDRIPKIFYPNSEIKAMIILKYTHLLMPISVTNKILVCCKVTLYHSGLKKCSHLRPHANHHYVHTAVNTKSQMFKKFLQLIKEFTQREWKSFKQDYL